MYHLVQKAGMSRCFSRIFAAIFICGLFSSFAFAQGADVPRVISYQGQISSNSGVPLSGDESVTVTLYADPISRHVIWRGKYDVTITNGLFTVLLGKGAYPLPMSDSLNRQLWVGIQIGESEEMKL